MSKYTAEQVSEWLRQRAVGRYIHRTDAELHLMADAIDVLLRERESAKAGVTDGWPEYVMLRDTGLHDDAGGLGQRIYTTAGSGYKKRKYILEAVAPMLASTHVNQEPYCYTVEQKNGLSQGAMCRTKAECEASPLFDPENDHVIPLYREPVLASARVPNAMKVPMLGPEQDVDDGFIYAQGKADGWNACLNVMLTAAPKPEVSERHHWLCCGALKPDHSDKPRVMPDCFDPERHVWAVSPKPETEE